MKNVERNRKDLVKYIEKDRVADWEFIYIEVFSKITKEYFRLILKESQVGKILTWAEIDLSLLGQEDKLGLSKLIVKCLDIRRTDEHQAKGDKKLLVSEEKYKQRDVLEKLSEIELKKIGNHY